MLFLSKIFSTFTLNLLKFRNKIFCALSFFPVIVGWIIWIKLSMEEKRKILDKTLKTDRNSTE